MPSVQGSKAASCDQLFLGEEVRKPSFMEAASDRVIVSCAGLSKGLNS